MSVLVLQGNGAERDHLISSLETHGFKPVRTLSIVSGLPAELADRRGLSAVVLDLALDPDLIACRQIRAADATLPLLVLFDEDSADRLEGAFQVGASGCVPEPINPLELAAKLRAAIRQNRRVQPPEPEGHLVGRRPSDESGERPVLSTQPRSRLAPRLPHGFAAVFGCSQYRSLRPIQPTLRPPCRRQLPLPHR